MTTAEGLLEAGVWIKLATTDLREPPLSPSSINRTSVECLVKKLLGSWSNARVSNREGLRERGLDRSLSWAENTWHSEVQDIRAKSKPCPMVPNRIFFFFLTSGGRVRFGASIMSVSRRSKFAMDLPTCQGQRKNRKKGQKLGFCITEVSNIKCELMPAAALRCNPHLWERRGTALLEECSVEWSLSMGSLHFFR